ncbi:acetamidase/formamidase family protein [Mycolicibacterium sp. P9-22]|uniref:acetamidase/formamidase family protein n=1 Tax=Mycolicibacterium sp. P9-22 TaxID=2024613 RepID=UPI0011EF9828|nr:acetamidase/formamidase family protein [Mycolicibacterium sp. P9-22]KAA0120320.1 acetamidase [Mycolicibacterium sp. P9-22]
MIESAPTGLPILQRGVGVDPSATYLPADPSQVFWGRLPCRDDRAAARISAGQTIVIDTVSHEGILEDQGSDPLEYFRRHGASRDSILDDTVAIAQQRRRDSRFDGPHIITGPIAIEGARPGDLLAVHIDDLRMRVPYGVISSRHHRGVLRDRLHLDATYSQFCTVIDHEGQWHGTIPMNDEATATAHFPLSPFLGIMGITPDTSIRPNSTPPGIHGGNIDIKLLTTGATLFLPVQVADALFYVGDPHFAQGDGEVALTALEAPLRATLTIDIIPAGDTAGSFAGVVGPFAVRPGVVIPTGMHEDLNQALHECVSNTVELITAMFEMSPRQAYLYASAATDFTISQAVDLVRGVHSQIRLTDFPVTSRTNAASHILKYTSAVRSDGV